MRISDWSSDVCSSDLFDRAPRYPDGARRGLDPRTLEGTHQLLEALPLRAAEQRVSGRPHRVELARIFAHPAIAAHLDLAPPHPVGGGRIGVRPARLRAVPHRQPRIALPLVIASVRQGRTCRARSGGLPYFRPVVPPLVTRG